MRPITMEEVERRREEILATIKDPTASHEQKVTYLARHAENFMTVLEEPEELDELMRCDKPIGVKLTLQKNRRGVPRLFFCWRAAGCRGASGCRGPQARRLYTMHLHSPCFPSVWADAPYHPAGRMIRSMENRRKTRGISGFSSCFLSWGPAFILPRSG